MTRNLSIILISFSLLLMGCSESEHITPAFENVHSSKQEESLNNKKEIDLKGVSSELISQELKAILLRNQITPEDDAIMDPNNVKVNLKDETDPELTYLKGKYFIHVIEFNKDVDGPKESNDVGNLIADIIVQIGGGFEVDLDPLPVDVSDLDLETFKDVRIQEMEFNIRGNDDPKLVNLKFIEKLQVYIHSSDDPSKKELLINFDQSLPAYSEYSRNCEWQCIRMDTKNIDITKYVGKDGKIYVTPVLKVGKPSEKRFFIGGFAKLGIGLKLNF